MIYIKFDFNSIPSLVLQCMSLATCNICESKEQMLQYTSQLYFKLPRACESRL